ncbi:MAG: hypothetical protein LWX56_05815 [Ignavibacteria bacterium]|nr:hypothetical protein [Ignavibacteria bacterium]
MDLVKQYLAQVVSMSSNNLRLSSEKIEIVGMLRELILHTSSIEDEVKYMKKVTEFSRLAIRFSEILQYLYQDKIDFLGFSEKFKEHCSLLIKDIGQFIESVNMQDVKNAMHKLDEIRAAAQALQEAASTPAKPEEPAQAEDQLTESEKSKEKYIFEDEAAPDDMLFQNYEAAIMRPIKPLDNLFKKAQKGEVHPDEFIQFAKVMKGNAELSAKFGTEIIANMHRIVAKGLILLKNREIMPGKEIVEALRSCLIVIVALVKGKEVDISLYLNRAEEFNNKIKSFKVKEIA